VPDRAFVLYDTLRRAPHALEPSAGPDGRPLLRFYSCGPTVYSYAHIGNFRTFLVADLVVRTAEALGWDVRYVSNVTDVGHLTGDDLADASGDDKMARALEKEGNRFANIHDLARFYTGAFLDDWQRLNLREPTVRPRATEHLREQQLDIEALIEKGVAYETKSGVYFHVPAFPGYGKLSGNTQADELAETEREVVRDPEKRDPRDFALWKRDDGHLMQWHSPFDAEGSAWGFPGWHIECSAMAQRYLGPTLDLHAGGEDLRFPHHECEIAQAEALTGEPFAKHWLHVTFLQVEGQKMSKSAGNFYTVRDLLNAPDDGGRADLSAPHDPLALRLALIAGHYRKPLNFTAKALRDAAKNARRFEEAAALVDARLDVDRPGPDHLGPRLEQAYDAALAAMADDLNTPVAIAAALRGVGAITSMNAQAEANDDGGLSGDAARSAEAFLDKINALLGIVRPETEAPEEAGDDPFAAEVEAKLAERQAAKKARDFATADRLRDEIAAMGVEVMDTPAGPTWRKKL
jgi:cysteinyl-tRNA synthetase